MISGHHYQILAILLFSLGLSAQAQESAAAKQVQDPSGVELGRMGDPVAVDPDEFEFSEAETKLWLDNHLANIDKPGRLYYKFRRTGSYDRGFKDSVYLDIVEINEDGTKDTLLDFFSGLREQRAEPRNLTRVTGNPVLGQYMSGDVREMKRLTDGSWRYFQRRIKTAFARGAKVEDVTVNYNGSLIQAEKITIRPYLDDPHRRDFEKFADKVYEFILSKQIPGEIYQIRTVIPDKENPDGEPLIQEELTFQQADFKS